MIEYIDYLTLKEFYTIQEICEIFGVEKADLKAKCEEFSRSEMNRAKLV